MKVGDRVVLKRGRFPKSKFRTGVVVKVGASWRGDVRVGGSQKTARNSVSIKRDDYKGHENTWWNRSDWKVGRKEE